MLVLIQPYAVPKVDLVVIDPFVVVLFAPPLEPLHGSPFKHENHINHPLHHIASIVLFLQCCDHLRWSAPIFWFNLLQLFPPFWFLFWVVIPLWFKRNMSGNHSLSYNSCSFSTLMHDFMRSNILSQLFSLL